MTDAYCYGMVAPGTLYVLEGAFPAPNGYAEVSRSLFNIAGEAVAGAWVLARLGLSAKLGGRWLADAPLSDELLAFLRSGGVDVSALRKVPGYRPVEEIVITDGKTRTIFGGYVKILFTERQWDPPSADDVSNSRIVLLDPFLGAESELCAEYCARSRVPSVSIDVKPESPIARGAAALIVSEEHLLRDFPEPSSWELIFRRYAENCPGLLVFTFGAEELWWAPPGKGNRGMNRMKPFSVEAKDSTGAGDSFRAAVAWGLLEGLGPEACLRRACALAAMVCERFPGVLLSPLSAELGAFLAEPARKGSPPAP
jgi:sugar/nucleoside kinase (ribokinase family)